MIYILLESFFLFFSLVLGAITYKTHSPFLRLLYFQVVLGSVFYIVANFLPDLQEAFSSSSSNSLWVAFIYQTLVITGIWFAFKVFSSGKEGSAKWVRILFILLAVLSCLTAYDLVWIESNRRLNHWLFNLYIIFESVILIWAISQLMISKRQKQVVRILLLLIFAAVIIHNLRFSFYTLAIYTIVIEGLAICLLFVFYLFNRGVDENTTWYQPKEFWAITGLAVYFVGYSPYFGAFDFLNTHYPALSTVLYYAIVQVLSNLRYLFLSISFWQARRQHTSKTVEYVGE